MTWSRWLVLFLLVFLAGALMGVILLPHEKYLNAVFLFWSLVSGLFGVMVGAAEIFSRYRDQPFLAMATKWGVAYLLANGLLSVVAFLLLSVYGQRLFSDLADAHFWNAVIAGFGAMGVMRSRLFVFRGTDGKEYPVGPDIVLGSFLDAVDRQIDRERAARREDIVLKHMSGVKNFSDAADFIVVKLGAFQNLTQDEQIHIRDHIERLKGLQYTDTLKAIALGFAILNVMGEEHFAQVALDLKAYLASLPTSAPPTGPAT